MTSNKHMYPCKFHHNQVKNPKHLHFPRKSLTPLVLCSLFSRPTPDLISFICPRISFIRVTNYVLLNFCPFMLSLMFLETILVFVFIYVLLLLIVRSFQPMTVSQFLI